MNPKVVAVAGGGLIVVVTSGLMVSTGKHEGRRYEAYQDVGDVWTVCDGETKGVIRGKVYTDDECDALKSGSLEAAGLAVLKCTPDTVWRQHEYEAITSLAYNVGPAAVCISCLPGSYCIGDLLRANRMVEACSRLKAFTKVRINGVLESCYDRRFNCYGLVVRRQAEYEHCMGGVAHQGR